MIVAGIRASFHLFNGAWMHVMRSPTSWHDRTPVSVESGPREITNSRLDALPVDCLKVKGATRSAY